MSSDAKDIERGDTTRTPSVDQSLEKDANAAADSKPVGQKPVFPEGGTWGWLTLLGATIVQFVTFGYTNAFGVYQGWIGGAQIFFIFSTGILTGRLFDRGYFYHLMIGGAFLHGFSLFMLSLSHENKYYQVFLSQGVGLGLSAGMVYLPSLSVVSHYFQHRRPMAMGVVAGGSALGATLYPIILNKFFHDSLGFHNGVRVSAGMNLFLLIIANLCMRTRLPPKPKGGSHVPILEFLRDPPYSAVLIGGMLVFFGLFYPVFYLQLDAITHGVEQNFAFYSIPILNASSVFGRSVPGFFAPRFGVYNMMVFFSIGSGIILLTMLAVKDLAGTAVFAIFIGFFTGGSIGLNAPMIGMLAKDVSEIGVRIGINLFFCGIIGLVATPIAGALLTSHYQWERPILFAGICMIGGGCFYALGRYFVVKRKGTQRT